MSKNFIKKLLESAGIGGSSHKPDTSKQTDLKAVSDTLNSTKTFDQLDVSKNLIINFIKKHEVKSNSPEYNYILSLYKLRKRVLKAHRLDEGEDDVEPMRYKIKNILREEMDDLSWMDDVPNTVNVNKLEVGRKYIAKGLGIIKPSRGLRGGRLPGRRFDSENKTFVVQEKRVSPFMIFVLWDNLDNETSVEDTFTFLTNNMLEASFEPLYSGKPFNESLNWDDKDENWENDSNWGTDPNWVQGDGGGSDSGSSDSGGGDYDSFMGEDDDLEWMRGPIDPLSVGIMFHLKVSEGVNLMITKVMDGEVMYKYRYLNDIRSSIGSTSMENALHLIDTKHWERYDGEY